VLRGRGEHLGTQGSSSRGAANYPGKRRGWGTKGVDQNMKKFRYIGKPVNIFRYKGRRQKNGGVWGGFRTGKGGVWKKKR